MVKNLHTGPIAVLNCISDATSKEQSKKTSRPPQKLLPNAFVQKAKILLRQCKRGPMKLISIGYSSGLRSFFCLFVGLLACFLGIFL